MSHENVVNLESSFFFLIQINVKMISDETKL